MPIPKEIRIKGVRVDVKKGSNSDSRRDLVVATNSEPDDVIAGQVKVLIVNNQDGAWLGGTEGHYHLYGEQYTAIGAAELEWYLQHVKTGARQKIIIKNGERLTIPPNVAHKVFANQGAVFVGVTAWPYKSSQQDIAFKVEATNDDYVPAAEAA